MPQAEEKHLQLIKREADRAESRRNHLAKLRTIRLQNLRWIIVFGVLLGIVSGLLNHFISRMFR
jgi:hypothetical protein